jgi:hypothetical protein
VSAFETDDGGTVPFSDSKLQAKDQQSKARRENPHNQKKSKTVC